LRRSEEEKRFLSKVCEQVRWKQAHETIARDLSAHIEDQAEAFEKAGYGEDEAAGRAVREMGDPVDVGLLLDASYRPKLEKRLLILLGLLVLAGVLVRAAFYRLSAAEWLTYGAALLLGAGCFLFMLHVNFYRMLQYAWHMEIGFILIACIIPIVWYRLSGDRFNINYAQMLWLLFPVIYALVVCRMRGTGVAGLLACGLLFCVPLVLCTIGFDTIGLYEATAAVACLAVTLVAIFTNVFQGSRAGSRRTRRSPSACGAFWVLVSEPHRFARLCGMFRPQDDPLGDGWLTLRIREMIEKAVWFGKGSALSSDTQAFAARNKSFASDYVLSYLMYEKGYIIAVALLIPVAAFLGFGFRRAKRIGSRLGKLLATAVLTIFTMQTALYVLPCFGYPFLSSAFFPFVTDGNLLLIVDFLLAGLLFSLFRTDALYADPPCRRLRLKFSIEK